MNLFNMTLSTAESWFNFFSVFSVVTAFLTFISGSVVFYTTLVKEEFAEIRMKKNELEVAVANQNAAEATLLSEQIKKQNLELQSVIEHEKIKRIELELSIQPRQLSAVQEQLLLEELSKVKSVITAELVIENDQEAINYGNQLLSVLDKSKKVTGKANIVTSIPPSIGMSINRRFDSPLAGKLKAAFDKAKIKTDVKLGNDSDFDVVIKIGIRPTGKL